ncbi:MAG: hypothetical protein LBK67_10415 [Coriobacteriales bacterium]|nr:hypothetical protein [Coriobacteriales bacterium]MDR2604785.1 hypothetical protein [Desulfovibrio sp.]
MCENPRHKQRQG